MAQGSSFIPDSQGQQPAGSTAPAAAPDPAVQEQQRQDALRARINEGLVTGVADAAQHPDSPTTFNYNLVNTAFKGLTSSKRGAFYDVPKTFQGLTPADQMIELSNRAGPILRGDQATAAGIREGMVVGIGAAGSSDSDLGHVSRTGVVYRDPSTQQLMVAESDAAGKLQQHPLADMLSDAKTNNQPVFAGDLVRLAEEMDARPTTPAHVVAPVKPAPKAKPDASHFTAPPPPPAAPSTAPVLTLPLTPPTGGTDGAAVDGDTRLAGLRAEINGAIQSTLDTDIAHRTQYKMGQNSTRFVDCSHFVQDVADSAFAGLLTSTDGHTRAAPASLHQTSEYQIDDVAKATGILLKDGDVNASTLREGMIVGVDTGDQHWDRGRPRGIDHIATIYRDAGTGQLMVAESNARKDTATHHSGPRRIELNAWLAQMHDVAKRNHNSQLHLYATDMAQLADNMGYSAPGAANTTAVALNTTTPVNTTAPTTTTTPTTTATVTTRPVPGGRAPA